jgi:hypothetical protein
MQVKCKDCGGYFNWVDPERRIVRGIICTKCRRICPESEARKVLLEYLNTPLNILDCLDSSFNKEDKNERNA